MRPFTKVLDHAFLGTDSETEIKIKNDTNNKTSKKFITMAHKRQERCIFAADCIIKTMINRARTSLYDKNKVFVKLYAESENIEELYFDENNQLNLPLTTPFVQKKMFTLQLCLVSFEGSFKIFHVDIADLMFLAKSAVNPKYCLLIVDLFTSRIYTYPMEKGRFKEES